ncbi:YebG family protein [Marinomonas ostreistagni]|uniref:YebG family protein n=1 Tax=Marinomonas ostreistagni TaxID=359209 RepID=UPI001951D9E9|nr:YebG family protein [Marinomonas ostreistagni]
MPVVVKYVVERNGVEKMTFSSKAQADQYDKLLETAENLEELLQDSGVVEDEQLKMSLAMYLAENKEDVLAALGNKRKKTPKKPVDNQTSEQQEEQQTLMDDLVIEPDESSYIEEDDSAESYRDDSDDYSMDQYSDSDAA